MRLPPAQRYAVPGGAGMRSGPSSGSTGRAFAARGFGLLVRAGASRRQRAGPPYCSTRCAPVEATSSRGARCRDLPAATAACSRAAEATRGGRTHEARLPDVADRRWSAKRWTGAGCAGWPCLAGDDRRLAARVSRLHRPRRWSPRSAAGAALDRYPRGMVLPASDATAPRSAPALWPVGRGKARGHHGSQR